MSYSKEKKKLYNKNYKQKNKEAIKEYNKNYKQKNKEAVKEYKKEYNQSEKGVKTRIISHWKSRGILDEDLSAVYDYYIKQTHCMICLIEYKDSFDRCLDHDHETGEIRYICCRHCNSTFLTEKNISL